MERTLCILKPDALRKGFVEVINARLKSEGFVILQEKHLQLSQSQAEEFYQEHVDRPFFPILCQNMMSGPVIVQILEKENAVQDYRTLMGETNPVNAAPGTLRKEFGESLDFNAVHGSDSISSAKREIAFFFPHPEA